MIRKIADHLCRLSTVDLIITDGQRQQFFISRSAESRLSVNCLLVADQNAIT